MVCVLTTKKAPVHTKKHQTFSRTAVEANFLKLIKAIYERPYANTKW